MSLRWKLLLPLVAACLIALAYLELVWIPRSLESQKHRHLEEVERHLDTVIEGLIPLMLSDQLDLIHENLGELRKKNKEWLFILLTNDQGKQLYPPLFSSPARQPAPGANVEVLDKGIRFLGRDLGRLTVHVGFAARLEQIEEQHWQLTLLLGATIALLALIWVGTLEAAVVIPLQRLSAVAIELAHRRFEVPLPRAGRDEVGMLIGSFAAMRDDLKAYHEHLLGEIDERRRAEQERIAVNASLERRVEERTVALETAYKDLESFSYSVSHDLRAPLRAINGFSKLLIESEGEKLSPDARQMLDRVATNATKLGQLIDDILEYSRSGRLSMSAAQVDLAALTRKIVAELAEDYPASAVDVGKLPVVSGDPVMLVQVMQNLISNALKFSSRQASPKVEIGMAGQQGEQVFFVRDNGAGFDMRYADKLFGMFQRMHSEREFPGTGVGLAIVKRLVERHGGRVWAEAEPDKGATFYFTLAKTSA